MGAFPHTLARLLLWIKKQILAEEDFNAIVSLVNHYEERSDRWLEVLKQDDDAILEPTLQTAYQIKQITNSKLGLGQVQKLLLIVGLPPADKNIERMAANISTSDVPQRWCHLPS